jgi:hypothetical protein
MGPLNRETVKTVPEDCFEDRVTWLKPGENERGEGEKKAIAN